ncbi:hypothetical protein BDV11DRAFT_201531 [Aspergillus similis]
MRVLSTFGLVLGLGVAGLAVPSADLSISSISTEVDSDQSTVCYGTVRPILFGNDGGAASGGICGFDLLDQDLAQTLQVTAGRTKVVGVLYDIGKRGRCTCLQSIIRVWNIGDDSTLTAIPGAERKALGNWSALCTWQARGGAGGSYFYLSGKKQAMQFLVREGNYTESEVEVHEVQTFALPNGEDAEISGLAVYITRNESCLFVFPGRQGRGVFSGAISQSLVTFAGVTDPEIQGTSIYQAKSTQYPFRVLSFAIESEEGRGFGVASLEPPSSGPELNGFPNKYGTFSCFAGFTGPHCNMVTCENSCSGSSYGICVSPNQCQCCSPYASPDSKSPNLSTIITTTKSEEGAGLATMTAGEPNNVDVIYGFKQGNRTVDLAYAAYREDDTLCLFEITPAGLLAPIPGGIQQVPQDYTYELHSSTNGTLSITLARDCTGGSSGQPKRCVPDEENGFIFLGEEPGLDEGYLIAKTADGTLYADVEGVSLLPGKSAEKGVYRQQEPHEHVLTFTIGRRLAEGGTAELASFKSVSLADVFGPDWGSLLGEVDSEWDQRALQTGL